MFLLRLYLPTHACADDEAGCLTPFGDLFNYAPPPGPHTLDVLDEEREAGDAESAARKDVELPTHLQSLPHISLSELPAPCHQPSRETQPSPPVSTVLLPPVSIPVLHHQTSLSSPQEPCDSQGSPEVLCGDGSYDERCGMYKLYARRSYTAGVCMCVYARVCACMYVCVNVFVCARLRACGCVCYCACVFAYGQMGGWVGVWV